MSGGARALRKIGKLVAGPAGEAAAEVVQGLQRVTQSLKGFVEALNPAVAKNFDTAMKELSATVGEALAPAFVTIAGVIREIADTIAPTVQELAAPIAEVADIIGSGLVDVVGSLVQILEPIIELFQALLPDIQLIAEQFEVLFRLLAAVAKVIAPIIGFIRPLIDEYVKFMKEVIKGLVLFTAYLLKAVGAIAALDALIGAFNPERAKGQRAAAATGSTSIKDLQAIGKDLATASANAQGTGPEKKNDDFIPLIYEALKDVKTNGKTLEQFLDAQFTRLVNAITNKGKDLLPNLPDLDRVKEGFDRINNAVGNPFSAAGNFGIRLGKLLRGG